MADETLVPIRLDGMAVHRLAVAGRLLRSRADADLSDLGVGGPGIGALLRLVEEDGLTQAELSRRQRVEAPSMCRLVDRLERDGLAERRADPGDRRATRVHISAEGRVLNELLGRVLDGLAPGGAPS